MLTVQAKVSSSCEAGTKGCKEVGGKEVAVLFIGLYLVALGVGGIKGSLPAHGAEQFDESTTQGRKRRSSFFNYFVFSLSCGALVAVTFVVWVEDNLGWQWGFGISTISTFLSIPLFFAGSPFYRNKIPTGSPLTTILKVFIFLPLHLGMHLLLCISSKVCIINYKILSHKWLILLIFKNKIFHIVLLCDQTECIEMNIN